MEVDWPDQHFTLDMLSAAERVVEEQDLESVKMFLNAERER